MSDTEKTKKELTERYAQLNSSDFKVVSAEDAAKPVIIDSTSDARTENAVRHKYRVLSETEKQAMAAVKDAAADFIDAINKYCPHGRETSIALTNAQQASMWAVAGITK